MNNTTSRVFVDLEVKECIGKLVFNIIEENDVIFFQIYLAQITLLHLY